MKPVIPTLFLIVVTAAVARLGETPDQTAKRYGPLIPSDGLSGPRHRSQGLSIRVTYGRAGELRDGKSVAGLSVEEQFQPRSEVPLTDAQLAAILDANLGSNSWKAVPDEDFRGYRCRTWRSTDDTRDAHLLEISGSGSSGQILQLRWTGARTAPKGF